MYYTYVLQSEVDHHFYVGYSMDLKLRGEMGTFMFLSFYPLSNQTDFLFLLFRPALIADSPPVD